MDFRAPLASVARIRYGAPTMASVHKQTGAEGVPVTIEDIRAAQKVPYRLLEEVPDLGYGDPAGIRGARGPRLDFDEACKIL